MIATTLFSMMRQAFQEVRWILILPVALAMILVAIAVGVTFGGLPGAIASALLAVLSLLYFGYLRIDGRYVFRVRRYVVELAFTFLVYWFIAAAITLLFMYLFGPPIRD